MVRYLLVLFLLVSAALAYSQPKTTYYYGDKIKTISNYKNGVLHGEFESFFSNGSKHEVGKYKNGEKNGVWQIYHAGFLWKIIPYTNGEKHGQEIVFKYQSTDTSNVITYIKGKKHGKYIEKYKNGNLSWVGYFDHGVKIDSVMTFHRNGVIKAVYPIKEGLYDGKVRGFNENGNLISESTYKKGYPYGMSYTYYPSGNLKSKVNYDLVSGEFFSYDNLKEDGLFESFYENGLPRTIGLYKKGFRVGEWKSYFENGDLKWAGRYKLDENFWRANVEEKMLYQEELDFYGKEGVWRERGTHFLDNYLSDGQDEGRALQNYVPKSSKKKINGFYLGTKDSTWTYYNPDGSVKAKTNYSNHLANGQFEWFENGEIFAEGTYLDGMRTGEWKVYHSNGVISYLAMWLEDRRIAPDKYFDESGKLVRVDSIKTEVAGDVDQDKLQKLSLVKLLRDLISDSSQLEKHFISKEHFVQTTSYPMTLTDEDLIEKVEGIHQRSKELSADHLANRILHTELIGVDIKFAKRKRDLPEFIEYDFRIILKFKDEQNSLRVETIWKDGKHNIKLIQSLDPQQ